jgi:hypothetical protein
MNAGLVLAATLFFGGAAAAIEIPETAMQVVVVKPGDTLWSIAHKYLKDPARWDEILKQNKLPTADPTVALPGMTLRVPVKLIKSDARAARLAYQINRVLYRRKDSAEWKAAEPNMELFRGDWLRTFDDSKARVTFLNKELLNLEPNSMAVIKPLDEDTDVELRSGSAFLGHSRLITANARVTPRTLETRYAASIEPDLTTRVEVFKGRAGVEAQGSDVEVPEGMQTRVAPGLAPSVPRAIENPPMLEARAQEFASAESVGGGAAPVPRALPTADVDVASLRGDIDTLSVGVPILGYHVQAARDKEFKQIVFNRKYEVDEHFSPADAALPPGAYWWRISRIDLLGTELAFETPRYYTVGVKHAPKSAGVDLGSALTVFNPEDGSSVKGDNVRVAGVLRDDRLSLVINGKPARIDADGNFTVTLPLEAGINEIQLVISDGKGNVTSVTRRVRRI